MRSKPLGGDFCFHLFLINCKLPLSFGLPRSADPGDTGALPASRATVPNCERLKVPASCFARCPQGSCGIHLHASNSPLKGDPTDVAEISIFSFLHFLLKLLCFN